MASKALSTGLRVVGSKQRLLLTGSCSGVTSTRVSAAYLTMLSKSSRVEPKENPKPWPYEKWGYNNLMAYVDSTLKRMSENSRVVVVEGPPGIGKSAVARALAEEFEMKYFPMVTSDAFWVNNYGYDFRQLDSQLPARIRSFDEQKFLKDPGHAKTALLQHIIWKNKFQQYVDALCHLMNTGQGVVLDRCVYSANVFTDTLVEAGYLSKHDRDIMKEIQNCIMHRLMKPHLIVYLDAPVSVVEANLKKRGRGEEKVWNKELLEKLEKQYKQNYLKTITEHAELVAYDWSTPGDADIIVEDIERIDFERFGVHDTKIEDWRLRESWDWNEKRHDFTHNQPLMMIRIENQACTHKVPALMIKPDESLTLEKVLEENKVPGTKYAQGYNIRDGDSPSIIWSTQPFPKKWKDFDLQKKV